MDPISITVIFKGIGMLTAIACGLWIARYGFHLYKDGAGTGRDQAAFEVGPVKLKAHSVGSVVMASAFLWAWAGVALSPNLDKKGDDIRVYSFNTPDMRVSSLEVETDSRIADSVLRNDPGKLKDLLKEALVNSDISEARPIVELNGKPATYDLHSIQALKSESGEVFLTTRVEGDGKAGTLAFEPKIENGRIRFVPAAVGRTSNGE